MTDTDRAAELSAYLKRIGAEQAGCLTTETGELWHPANLLLPAATLIEQQATRIRKDALRIGELEKDAARLDWLDSTGRVLGHGFCHEAYGEYSLYVNTEWDGVASRSARQVIDAAIEAGKVHD